MSHFAVAVTKGHVYCCSLNRDRRMRELLRIAQENQQILKRLQSVQPKYSHARWEQEWQTNLQLIDHMSLYPVDWWKNRDQVTTPFVITIHSATLID